MAEDDDFSDTSDLPSSNVQLGFVEEGRNEMFLSTRWQDWDGGKIGGWPVSSQFNHLECRLSLTHCS